ncbi:hypothetical protein C8J38_104292 [Rhizobium sp. PP-WC-2G-219]|nr:hypothetical protein C8J38_104292 [Rhizobium sp. PP-WC-2G-219]
MKHIAAPARISVLLALLMGGTALAQDRIRISSEWGDVTANLTDNVAAEALSGMLPLTIEMDDHLRQEKTGNLPKALPAAPRQRAFSAGTLGWWNVGDMVIYYRDGRVPPPGIVILGQIDGDVSIFDRPGKVTITVDKAR